MAAADEGTNGRTREEGITTQLNSTLQIAPGRVEWRNYSHVVQDSASVGDLVPLGRDPYQVL